MFLEYCLAREKAASEGWPERPRLSPVLTRVKKSVHADHAVTARIDADVTLAAIGLDTPRHDPRLSSCWYSVDRCGRCCDTMHTGKSSTTYETYFWDARLEL